MSDDDAGFFRNLSGLATEYVREKRRSLAAGDPETNVDSMGGGHRYTFGGQEVSFDDLRDVKDIRESGGQVAQLMDYKALLNFGEGAEIHVEDNEETAEVVDGDELTLEEWLETEAFPKLDLTVLDLGGDALWYPCAVGEIQETVTGDFKRALPAEPWTIIPVTNEHGEVEAYQQRTKAPGGGYKEQTLPAEDLWHIVINKSSARDETGISEVLRNKDEIRAFKENEAAINQAIELHGFPQRHVKVGREEGAPVSDNDLRRVRTIFDPRTTDGNTAYFTGQDVDVETLEAHNFDYSAIHEMDMRNLTTALGLPLEAGNVGADGLGSGKPAELRFALLKLAIKGNQRSFGVQFVERVMRPVIRDYSPFDHNETITLDIADPLEDIGEVADLINSIGDYMTNEEIRSKLDMPAPEDEEIAQGYRSPADIEAPEDEGPGGGGMFFREARTLSVPDNAVSISDRSEAPEGATIIEGDRGGLYYIPSGDGDGGDGAAVSPIVSTADELPSDMNPNNAVDTDEFDATGVDTGQDFTIARMPDGEDDLLVKEGVDGGEAQATSATAMREIDEDSAPETMYIENEDAVVQKLAGENTVEEQPANQESFTETFATTALIGDADPNANNFIVDDGGNVSNVDSEGIVDISQDWATDAINTEIDTIYADMGYNSPDAAREAINDSIEEQISDVDVDALDEQLPDTFVGNQIVENVQSVKDSPRILRSGGDTGNRCLGEGVTDQELQHAPEWDRPLLEMYRGVTDPNSDPDRALVSFAASGTPEFVLERIREAIMGGALFSDFEDVPSSELMDFRQEFADALGTDNFTLDDVTDRVMDFADVDRADAERIARTETASTLNSARLEGYDERGELEDSLFYWTGAEPGDHRQTEACEWLIRQTNPFHGGTPRPMDELQDMIGEAWEHDDEMDRDMSRPNNLVVHINERSTAVKAPPGWQDL